MTRLYLKSNINLCVSFSRTDHLFLRSNISFLHSSQWITWLTLLCLVLYSYYHYFTHLKGFHRTLSDSKFSPVYRTLLNILSDLNNVVFWIVSTRPFISKTICPCTNLLMTVPSVPITTSIIVTFMLHSFSVIEQGLGMYLSFRIPLALWSAGAAMPIIRQVLFVDNHFLWCLAEIRWSVCISKSQSILFIWFYWSHWGLSIYHLLV